jgi:hypothetical protein
MANSRKGWETRREREAQERREFERRSRAAKTGWETRRFRALEEKQDKRWAEWDYIEEPIDEEGGYE